MSSAEQAAGAASTLQAALLRELEDAIPGINATRYLSVAGLVILLYDHMLLFGEEKRLIWTARPSWSKSLFLVNRYTVPICLIVTAYPGWPWLVSQLLCQIWLSMASFLCASHLAVANIFVVHRIYALWGRNKQILKLLVSTFCVVFLATIIAAGFSVADMFPHVSYSPPVKTCIISKRPTLYELPFAVPIAFDVFLFFLTCWNAFDRPRSIQTAIVNQLYIDGAVYFAALLSLRLFNILIVAFANLAYIQLGIYFIWSMITTLINRMLITISAAVDDPRSYDMSGRETPFERMDAPFELTELESHPSDLRDFIDMSYDVKEYAPRLPRIDRGQPFQV